MNPGPYLALTVAIATELVATSALKLSDGFTKPNWLVLVAVGYGVSFWTFSLALKTIPLGIAYATWAGIGIVGTALIGLVVFRQSLGWLAIAGLAIILIGTVVANLGLRAR